MQDSTHYRTGHAHHVPSGDSLCITLSNLSTFANDVDTDDYKVANYGHTYVT